MESSRGAVAGSVATHSGALEACQVPGSVSFLADLTLHSQISVTPYIYCDSTCHAMPLTFYSFYSFLERAISLQLPLLAVFLVLDGNRS